MSRTTKLCTLIFALTFTQALSASGDLKLEAAARSAHRSVDNVARNVWRHPVETLEFFGIKDSMTVVEIWPGGGGWYTEILAPYLRDTGVSYAANYDGNSGSAYYARNDKKFRDKLAALPEVYDQVRITTLMPPTAVTAAPPSSADMVVSFRNLHNWVRAGLEQEMLKAIYEVLKPAGVFGLVAHRGTPEMVGTEWATKGYVSEAEAIRLAESAGFTLVGRSEINANANDTKDYADGVWTLPPAFRRGDNDKEKYAAIGESDRMTLKFTK
ncbi:MAG: putative methyltransferase [Gammaproteobacteria bacterium]|jgi:predicted methyltransferase